ncbi:AraC family transcriptional regulator [Paenibacillus sp. FSL H8-0457]|uniref:helix-turn-helix transcriptional regulator n=1 Tax=Bacillales TaxID=1385 RepID=UPI0001787E30|nr:MULTISPECIES: AraC family transcriptional regulator [Paenibacillus]ACX64588.1 transcriptional regulator, AraC family [Paenibacillus sp. Y412MC10]ETT58265.1 AraC family transcriptional regulator [Paenibacillus sp. FSL H8-457]MCM3256912.1 AraC family transcriptional regulator [Paenibacillus lautus]
MKRQSHLLTLPQMPFFCLPESVGIYRDEPDHTVTRAAGSLNNFNIHYVATGKGHVEIDNVVHTLGPGEAVLYFPMQAQHYYSSEDDPWDVRWFHFYGSGLQNYFIERGFHKSQLWSIRQPAVFEEAHEALLNEAETHRMLKPAQLSTLTYSLLAVFVEQASSLSDNKSNNSANRIHELLPIMQQEAAQPFILEEWAARLGVSTYYFCKLFRNVMEMTPMDFVTRCRLQMAKQWLLDHKDKTIGQIAVEAGYPSVSYFNKRFMEHEGMTPSSYRRLYGV